MYGITVAPSSLEVFVFYSHSRLNLHLQIMQSSSVLLAFVLSLLPDVTLECYANGVCGWGGYCGGYAPPPPPCARSSCGGSYSCGSYGCYRARARSSKTLQVRRFPSKGAALASDRAILQEKLSKTRAMAELDPTLAHISETAASLKRSVSPNARRIDPNRAFYDCCLDRKLPDACLAKCNYGAYNKEALTQMYFKNDACPIEAMTELQFCAAQGRDHRACCARNGVTTTLAGPKCLIFCDQTPNRVSRLDFTFMPCFDRFESMKACFWHDIAQYFRA